MQTVCGIHAVREALRSSPERVRKVILVEGRLDGRARDVINLARSQEVPVYREKRSVLDKLHPGGHHQGVVAEMGGVSWRDLDELVAKAPDPALFLALDRVADPRNFGAAVRAADGAGIHGIIVPERGAAPPSAVAVAASAGALLHVPLARVVNLADTLKDLKKKGLWVVGLSPEGSQPWHHFDLTVPLVVVLGSEGTGIRRRVAGMCDALLSLPQHGQVASLNVSVATGIILYEALRQREQAR